MHTVKLSNQNLISLTEITSKNMFLRLPYEIVYLKKISAKVVSDVSESVEKKFFIFSKQIDIFAYSACLPW